MGLTTGWVSRRHECTPPTLVHESLAKTGKIWRCECGREWEINRTRPVKHGNHEVLYILLRVDESAIGPKGRGVDRGW